MKRFPKPSMLRWSMVFLTASSLPLSSVCAQDAPDQAGTGFPPANTEAGAQVPRQTRQGNGPRILEIDAARIGTLQTLPTHADVDAVSLGVSLARLRANPAAQQALMQWVHDGGVVFLHTDAAQAFGYSTVPARATTRRTAGQLFGRARAALPFGSHPLLWGAVRRGGGNGGGANAAQRGQNAGALGVHVVYYEMREGDALVRAHPAGVPLLRVTDLAGAEREPLLAAAMAPFGRGWAVFTPAVVETHRADGGVFLQNLTRLVDSSVRAMDRDAARAVPPAGVAPKANLGPTLTSLPATLIEQTGAAFSKADDAQINYPAIAQEFQRALAPPDATGPTDPNAPNGANVPGAPAPATTGAEVGKVEAPRLMLTQQEATLASDLVNAARTTVGVRPYAKAFIYLLCARLELQRDNLRKADTWLQAAENLRPDTAEPLLWRGIIAAGQAEDITLSSRDRASLFNNAADSWSRALRAAPLVQRANSTATAGGATATGAATGAAQHGTDQATLQNIAQGDPQGAAQGDNTVRGNISGVPRELIRAWAASSGFAANIMSVEPPLTEPLGNADSGLVLRHFPNDPSLRLAVPAGNLVTRSSAVLGWHADEEELLIFPTPEYYAAYRQAAGLGNQSVPNPAGSFGDIVGSRMMMISQPSLPIILPSAGPGQPPRAVQLGTSVAPVVARMHGYVLINALAGGGTPVPDWIQLGLVGLDDSKVSGVLSGAGGAVDPTFALRQYAGAGRLLTADQFRGVSMATGGNGPISGLAEAQGMAMMAYFYDRFGAGFVVETLQRLGAGQSVDDALNATTGMDEQGFFRAWYNDTFR